LLIISPLLVVIVISASFFVSADIIKEAFAATFLGILISVIFGVFVVRLLLPQPVKINERPKIKIKKYSFLL